MGKLHFADLASYLLELRVYRDMSIAGVFEPAIRGYERLLDSSCHLDVGDGIQSQLLKFVDNAVCLRTWAVLL